MKKTLLATAVAASMAATGAQAATVYDQDGKSLDISGRIGVAAKQGYDGNSDFVNAGSRLKLTGSNQFTRNTRAFGHIEWRFDADENNDEGFTEVRHSYIGLEDNRFGTVMAGNFDNVYTSNVFGPFDYYAMSSAYGFTAMGTNGRGDSVAYMTPNLEGFQVFVAAKHYSQDDIVSATRDAEAVTIDAGGGVTLSGERVNFDGVDSSSKVLTSGGVSYAIEDFEIAAGWTEAVDSVESAATGDFEDDYHAGVRLSYAFNDMITGRMGWEDQRIDDTEVFGIGMTAQVMPQLTLVADYYNKDVDGGGSLNEYAFGAYYNIADNFDVFSEFHDSDDSLGDENFFLVGSRYFF